MANFTKKLELVKPEQDDFYNVDDFNNNFEKIDKFLDDIVNGNIDLVVKSIKSVNLFDYDYVKKYNNTTIDVNVRFVKFNNLKSNTEYTISNYDLDNAIKNSKIRAIYISSVANATEGVNTNLRGMIYNANLSDKYYKKTYTSSENSDLYLAVALSEDTEILWNEFISNFEKSMLNEGAEAKEYSPHQF